jgi:hypothetical protein
MVVVAWGGIEPPTRGFSILPFPCSPSLIRMGTLYANQRFSFAELDG